MPLTDAERRKIKEIEAAVEQEIQKGRHEKAAINRAIDELMAHHEQKLKEIRARKVT